MLSGGRFRLGLGVSGPQVSEGWHGVPFARPLARTREYVEIVRAALAREGPLEYRGQEFQLPIEGGTGLGKPLKLLARPVQEQIPIYLGSMGPKAIEQTAQIADGWLPSMFSPPSSAASPSGARTWTSRRSSWSAWTRTSIAPAISPARGSPSTSAAMGAKEKNFYVEAAERSGQGEAAREVQRRYLAGDRAGAAAALTPELIDSSAVCCRLGGARRAPGRATSAPAPPPCSRCRSATAPRSSTSWRPQFRLAESDFCVRVP